MRARAHKAAAPEMTHWISENNGTKTGGPGWGTGGWRMDDDDGEF